MKLYANLHNHTTHSDGVYSPTEIVKVAYDEGYKAFAVADHDVVTAYPEMKAACEKYGMDYVFACEFSSPCKELHDYFHIVGFSFDPEYPAMKQYLERRSFTETNQTKVLFDRGLEIGYLKDITWQEVLDFNKTITWLCNEHVFRCLKAKGMMTDTDYPDFFQTLYGSHRGEVPDAYPYLTAREIIQLIHNAGGIAVVAHPQNQLKHIDALLEMGIDGLEIWHKMLDKQEKIEGLELAIKHNLFISGGEDHSGLCGGQYARYATPQDCPGYVEPLTLGTTEFFFNEIKSGKLSENRNDEIRRMIEIVKNED